jgi:phosphoglycolate phosphatase-like HAD superfamily hydrolase
VPADPKPLPLMESAEAVLLDFDGPVCSLFAGYPASGVADHLRDLVIASGAEVGAAIRGTTDPLTVLRLTAEQHPALLASVDDALTLAERVAAHTARSTPGALEFLIDCDRARRPVVIVSNNSRDGVEVYLQDRHLWLLVGQIFGRPVRRPDLMKPHPARVDAALAFLQVDPERAVLIGDSVSDLRAAQACRVPFIGYADRPEKRDVLVRAGADVVIDSLSELLPGPI